MLHFITAQNILLLLHDIFDTPTWKTCIVSVTLHILLLFVSIRICYFSLRPYISITRELVIAGEHLPVEATEII